MGVKGSFWADPATYDIVRISMEADEIPPELPVATSTTSIDYAHTNLGGTDFLLPQSADSRLVRFSGEESRNHIEFTHCHLYGAQSSISFGAAAGVSVVRREFRSGNVARTAAGASGGGQDLDADHGEDRGRHADRRRGRGQRPAQDEAC